MTENNQGHRADRQNDELDRALDAALAKYALVEPRVGMADRILATLSAQQADLAERAWWRWGFAVAAVVVIAAALAWKTTQPLRPVAVNRPAIQNQEVPKAEAKNAKSGASVRHSQTHARIRRPSSTMVAARPKLDQFPSARPLSEQEELALEYVQRFPEEASLAARVQTAFAKQEELETNNLSHSGDFPVNVKQE